ncbi:MAG: FlgD immunoglobulin-like domain containing protein, partial [Salinibacter sp.]|uniref:FlgD immunoglobulin-like domain containing protein n=1 Tax=Salinibacter sp. TaxID=2065818 RepID=UPI0035D457DD
EPAPDEDPTADRGFCDDFFNELNHGSAFIKRYIDRANEYWIEEFNVDGFRFDLAKCVADDGVTVGESGYTDAVTSGWKSVSDHVWDTVDADTYMILEFFGSPSVENELGGYRAGETGSMMTWHNMNRPYSQSDMGFLEGGDFSSDFSAAYYENRSGYDQPSYIAYMESHDEQWLMRRKKAFGNSAGNYSTRTLDTALNRQKLVGAFYFTVPGPRMMWQFGELGYGWGPDECLKPSDACSAGDPGRTAPKPIRWEYSDPDQNPGRVKLYKTWSALIDLRTRSEVFTSLQTDVSMKVGNGDYGRRIVLEHDSMDAVVVGNMGVTARDVATKFPSTGTWYDYFTGQEVNIESAEQDAAVSMAPGEFHVYTSEPVDFPEAGLVPWTVAVPPPEAPTSLETSFNDDGTVVSLSWSASTAGDVTGYQIYRSTAADFDTTGTRIATVGPQTTSYDDSTVTSGAAYYYRVAARDNDGLRSPATAAVLALQYPETLTIQASRSFGDGQDPNDYRLIALPGEVDRGLAETFDGEAGDAWQAYWDDGSAENHLQKFDGSSTFDLRPGRGFWAISESSWNVSGQVSTVPLRETTAGQAAVVSLREGWNIISNPLDTDVAWSNVEAANGGSLQPLWRFDGSFSRASTFASAKAGEAFYFYNQTGRTNLRIPYAIGADGASDASSKQHRALLSVTAHGPDDATSTVRVGRSNDAEDGVGTEDAIAPTTKFAALSLHVRAQDAEVGARGRTLARSIRAADDGAGEMYELSLRSKLEGPIRLSVENVAGSMGPEVRLVNQQTGATHDLGGPSSVTVNPDKNASRWTLLTGSQTFVEEKGAHLRPESLKLWPTYPNPFRQQAMVEYALPEAGPVTVTVYDLLGRRVRVLVDGRQEAGLHRVRWNGRGGSGSAAASGVYIVRVKAA